MSGGTLQPPWLWKKSQRAFDELVDGDAVQVLQAGGGDADYYAPLFRCGLRARLDPETSFVRLSVIAAKYLHPD